MPDTISRVALRRAVVVALALTALATTGCGGGSNGQVGGGLTDRFVCRYEDPYSGYPECREYVGPWTEEQAVADCNSLFSGVTGEVDHESCDRESAFGVCTIVVDESRNDVTWYYGGPVDTTMEVCTGLLGGTWADQE
jgi:hypothetical protein